MSAPMYYSTDTDERVTATNAPVRGRGRLILRNTRNNPNPQPTCAHATQMQLTVPVAYTCNRPYRLCRVCVRWFFPEDWHESERLKWLTDRPLRSALSPNECVTKRMCDDCMGEDPGSPTECGRDVSRGWTLSHGTNDQRLLMWQLSLTT